MKVCAAHRTRSTTTISRRCTPRLLDEDIWDIGAIAAFFALSNRMANLIGMRPNASST